MDAQTYFKQRDLDAAKNAIIEEVKQAPANANKRAFYAELLCFTGDYEKADKQLDTLLKLDPGSAMAVTTWRQLIRAAQSRQDVFDAGKAPDIIKDPSSHFSTNLESLVAYREGNMSDALELIEKAETLRNPIEGSINGNDFSDIRDLDDILSGFLEVMGTNGKYFWVAFDDIQCLQLTEAARPLDMLWRQAHLELKNGTEGEVFIPMTYHSSETDADIQMGYKTEWQGDDNTPYRGHGLKTYLVGEEAISLNEINILDFSSAS